MNIKSHSRRHFLSRLLLSLPIVSFLSACGFGNNTQKAIDTLINLLRHHGVAAHLGRLNVETHPSLQSLTRKQLTSEILADIGLDFDTFEQTDPELIRQLLDERIRQDFTEEQVVTVDGWLLSQTEAKICALLYRNLEKQNT